MNRIRRRPNPRSYVPPPQPLMSNQLGLQDIDLELELLKRKREIIEQQQQMLNNDRLSGNRFGEFSHMYEDRGSYGSGSSGGKKRPQVWEHDSPPKRFATGNISAPNKSYNPPFRAQVKKPSQSGFQPRSSGYQQRGYKSGPNPSVAKKKDFKPNKVSKPSAAPPSNKLSSYSQADRRNIVTETINSDTLTLRVDRPTTNQLNGRLELALGHIIKDIRAKFPEYEEQFKNNVGRTIKQALRDRLRACMMGKTVTGLQDTIKVYRESFPPETDKDLLLNSLEVQLGTDFVPIESDNPQEFFTKNLGRLMTKKMEEMFNKLGEIYSNDNPQQRTRQRRSVTALKTTNTNNSDVIDIDEKPNDADDVKIIPEQKDKNADNAVIEITDTDAESSPKKEKDTEITSNKEKDTEISSNKDKGTETSPSKDKGTDTSPNKDKSTEASPNKDEGEDDEKYKNIVSTEEYKRLDRLMTGMMPHMLKKFTPVILKTMKLDAMYRKTFSGIKQDLRKKITFNENSMQKHQHLPKPIQKSVIINDNIQNKQDGDHVEMKQPYQPLSYFVKILGRPSIPKRKAMQSFFDQFNPKSIKKHRTVHNILFVGFADKQDFDNILAANGTVIGRNTLTIKVSERSKPTAPPNMNKDSSDSFLTINEDLDEQITELLSSIKKSEGLLDDDENTSNDIKPEVKTENDTTMADNEDKTEVEKPENGVIEESVQDNDDSQAIEESNEVIAPQVVDTIDTNIEKQDGINENIEEPNTDNNVPADEDKGNVENPQENIENVTEIEAEIKDTVSELKNDNKEVKGTPTRSSARLASSTPSSIRTRRASKLSENNS